MLNQAQEKQKKYLLPIKWRTKIELSANRRTSLLEQDVPNPDTDIVKIDTDIWRKDTDI